MRKLLLALPLLVGAVACSKDSEAPSDNQLINNNFESVEGWGDTSPSLNKEQAHSGKYSIKVDKDIEYSLSYRNELGKMMAAKPKKLQLSAWCYLSSPTADAKLTLQVLQSPQDMTNIYNDGISLKEAGGKPGEWVKVSKEFTLPENVTSTNEIRVYVWRGGNSEPVYVDDVTLTAE